MSQIGYPLPSTLDKDYRFIMDNALKVPFESEVRTTGHFGTLRNHVTVCRMGESVLFYKHMCRCVCYV